MRKFDRRNTLYGVAAYRDVAKGSRCDSSGVCSRSENRSLFDQQWATIAAAVDCARDSVYLRLYEVVAVIAGSVHTYQFFGSGIQQAELIIRSKSAAPSGLTS